MFSKILIAGVFAVSFSGFASAADMKECNDETFSMVMKQVEEAPAEKKEMAMAELAMAKEKMAASMSKDCSMHLENASKASMKK